MHLNVAVLWLIQCLLVLFLLLKHKWSLHIHIIWQHACCSCNHLLKQDPWMLLTCIDKHIKGDICQHFAQFLLCPEWKLIASNMFCSVIKLIWIFGKIGGHKVNSLIFDVKFLNLFSQMYMNYWIKKTFVLALSFFVPANWLSEYEKW